MSGIVPAPCGLCFGQLKGTEYSTSNKMKVVVFCRKWFIFVMGIERLTVEQYIENIVKIKHKELNAVRRFSDL